MIKDYKLITSTSTDELEQGVVAMLEGGWKVYGSPTMAIKPSGWVEYCQAVVKEAEKPFEHSYKLEG